MLTSRVVRTWDQMTLGGGFVRFHSETTNATTYVWECNQPDCDDCHNCEQENKP